MKKESEVKRRNLTSESRNFIHQAQSICHNPIVQIVRILLTFCHHVLRKFIVSPSSLKNEKRNYISPKERRKRELGMLSILCEKSLLVLAASMACRHNTKTVVVTMALLCSVIFLALTTDGPLQCKSPTVIVSVMCTEMQCNFYIVSVRLVQVRVPAANFPIFSSQRAIRRTHKMVIVQSRKVRAQLWNARPVTLLQPVQQISSNARIPSHFKISMSPVCCTKFQVACMFLTQSASSGLCHESMFSQKSKCK